jgi:hypothetical protein
MGICLGEFVFVIATIEKSSFWNQFHRKMKQVYLIDDKKAQVYLRQYSLNFFIGFIDTTVDV